MEMGGMACSGTHRCEVPLCSSFVRASSIRSFQISSGIKTVKFMGVLASQNAYNYREQPMCWGKGYQLSHELGYTAVFQRPGKHASSLAVSCVSYCQRNEFGDAKAVEKKLNNDLTVPDSSEVESLITTICDTNSIAEVKLNVAGFSLYIKRNLVEDNVSLPATTQISTSVQASESNGAATTSLTISKPKPSLEGIQRIIATAKDDGLVILQSPKVGYFRRSRTIKGKRAPPSCKEKQGVKEGQVLCYIEQLGGEIPIESDVSGEVIKILRKDGEPVGYGDDLIAILPSFPGI